MRITKNMLKISKHFGEYICCYIGAGYILCYVTLILCPYYIHTTRLSLVAIEKDPSK